MSIKDEAGDTPLDIASELSLSLIRQVLIANGADPAVKNTQGASPLVQTTPTSCSMFPEDVIKGLSDDESQLLEAAKSGNMDLVKVHYVQCT